MPYAALRMAVAGLSSAGGQLVLDAVTVPENPEWGAQTGTVTARAEGELPVLDPPGMQLPAYFFVNSGSCTVAEGGRCVGRWPGGDLPNEDCTISVGGVGGVAACPVFDISGGEYLTLPDGSAHAGTDCPAGAVLAGGQTLVWHPPVVSMSGGWQPTGSASGGWQICV